MREVDELRGLGLSHAIQSHDAPQSCNFTTKLGSFLIKVLETAEEHSVNFRPEAET